MKIDIFAHIMPEKYDRALEKVGSANPRTRERHRVFPPVLFDLDRRFACLDKFGDVVQVLSMGEPLVEQAADAQQAVELARIANDELAELVAKYPGRFAAAIATLPMNNVDAAWRELDRAIDDLKLRGVQVASSIDNKPLDAPEFLPLFEKMARCGLPIWIHPARSIDYPDYRTEIASLYNIYFVYAWPHETSVAMVRLACSGVLEKFPDIKIITHHCGGTVPYLAARIADLGTMVRMTGTGKYAPLTREPLDYLRMFYADTANYGQTSALGCGYEFFGAGHLLFGTDMPFSVGEPGVSGVRQVIGGIESLPVSDAEKEMIYEGNARRLLRLP